MKSSHYVPRTAQQGCFLSSSAHLRFISVVSLLWPIAHYKTHPLNPINTTNVFLIVKHTHNMNTHPSLNVHGCKSLNSHWLTNKHRLIILERCRCESTGLSWVSFLLTDVSLSPALHNQRWRGLRTVALASPPTSQLASTFKRCLDDPQHKPEDLESGDGWVPGRGVKADECVCVCADSAWLHAFFAALITEDGKMKAFTVWLVSLFTRTERSAEQPSINKPLFLSGQSAMYQRRKWHQQTELRFTRGQCHNTCRNST